MGSVGMPSINARPWCLCFMSNKPPINTPMPQIKTNTTPIFAQILLTSVQRGIVSSMNARPQQIKNKMMSHL